MNFEKSVPWKWICLCIATTLFIYGLALMGTDFNWKWIFKSNIKARYDLNKHWDSDNYTNFKISKRAENVKEYCFDCLYDLDLDTLKFLLYGMVTSKVDICENKKVGNENKPGGYFVCFSGNLKPNKTCKVLSFGIDSEWSFDEGMSKHDCYVHSFDPSMGVKNHMHKSTIEFHNLGLGEYNHVNTAGWEIKDIMTILKDIKWNDEVIDVIKCDAEGAEWPFLEDILKHEIKVKQIIVEIHSMVAYPRQHNKDHYVYMIDLFRRLKSEGYLVWKGSHVYNCCGYYVPMLPPGYAEKCCYEVYLYNTRYA